MPPPRGKLTQDRLLTYLLGAKPTVRKQWWGGVELVVPEGASPPFIEAELPALGAGPPRLADPVARERILAAMAHPSRTADGVTTLPVGEDRGLELRNPAVVAGLVPIPGRDVPRLRGARLSSAELFDLRLAYRRLFGPNPRRSDAPWRSRLAAVLTNLKTLAGQDEVQLAAYFALHAGEDTIETRAVAVLALLDRPERLLSRRRLPSLTMFGFGTIRDPLPTKRSAGGKVTAGAFVDCCAQLGLDSPSDIAAVAALEHAAVNPGAPQPSFLRDRAGAIRYWTKKKSDRRRR